MVSEPDVVVRLTSIRAKLEHDASASPSSSPRSLRFLDTSSASRQLWSPLQDHSRFEQVFERQRVILDRIRAVLSTCVERAGSSRGTAFARFEGPGEAVSSAQDGLRHPALSTSGQLSQPSPSLPESDGGGRAG